MEWSRKRCWLRFEAPEPQDAISRTLFIVVVVDEYERPLVHRPRTVMEITASVLAEPIMGHPLLTTARRC